MTILSYNSGAGFEWCPIPTLGNHGKLYSKLAHKFLVASSDSSERHTESSNGG